MSENNLILVFKQKLRVYSRSHFLQTTPMLLQIGGESSKITDTTAGETVTLTIVNANEDPRFTSFCF